MTLPLQNSIERRRCTICGAEFDGALWAMQLLSHFGKEHSEELPAQLVNEVAHKYCVHNTSSEKRLTKE